MFVLREKGTGVSTPTQVNSLVCLSFLVLGDDSARKSMKLWKKAIGAIKDKNSIVVVYVSRRNSLRNPDLEAAIIKATSHDEHHIDKRNAQIVFSWIRASPISIRPFIRALSKRMEKTRSWVVAIKGLMLIHGVFHCKVPIVQMMKRLPFDLSSFSDGHSKPNKTWGFNSIIREYFAFLEQRAALYSFEQDDDDDDDNERSLVVQQLLRLEKLQSLIDLLLQIRPQAENMKVRLILEVMNCVIIEIFDVYGLICSEIAKVLLKIYSISKLEALMALNVLRKARKQGEEISLFFEFCKEFGVLNANGFPDFTQIPQEGVEELERIINGVSISEKRMKNNELGFKEMKTGTVLDEPRKLGDLKTIITDKWVSFDEEQQYDFSNENEAVHDRYEIPDEEDDGAKNQLLPLVPIDIVPPVYKHYEIPDFISF